MINHSRYRLFLILSSVLALLSMAMFIYQHFFYEDSRLKDLSTVYIFQNTVDAHETVEPNDLKPIQIPTQALISGMITDLSTLTETPHYARHSLSKGEILVDSQLITENLNNEGTLLVPLTGTYISDIYPGDMVSFYTIQAIYDETGTRHEIERLFTSKKVYASGLGNVIDTIIEGVEYENLYIKVTETEMNAYYQALKNSEIIIAKHLTDIQAMIEDITTTLGSSTESTQTPSTNSGQTGNHSTNNSQSNTNSSESNGNSGTINPPLSTENSTTSSTEADRGTVRYRVGENETWETIAMKFKTDKNTLYKLNPDTLTIQKGTELIVPTF